MTQTPFQSIPHLSLITSHGWCKATPPNKKQLWLLADLFFLRQGWWNKRFGQVAFKGGIKCRCITSRSSVIGLVGVPPLVGLVGWFHWREEPKNSEFFSFTVLDASTNMSFQRIKRCNMRIFHPIFRHVQEAYPPWNQQFAPENRPSQKEISSSNHPFLMLC